MKEGILPLFDNGNFLNPEVVGFFNAMFTGIITHLGTVCNKTTTSFSVKTDQDFFTGLEAGTSVAVNGICLTVAAYTKDSFQVNIMPETANRTNIQYLQPGNLVNLELPATANSFLSGHIVQGHVDGTGRLQGIAEKNHSHILKLSIPDSLSKYLVRKGSVAVNGIALTIMDIAKNYFTVGIIPHTWKKTMLHTLQVGEFVNVEVDILAKYVERLLRERQNEKY